MSTLNTLTSSPVLGSSGQYGTLGFGSLTNGGPSLNNAKQGASPNYASLISGDQYTQSANQLSQDLLNQAKNNQVDIPQLNQLVQQQSTSNAALGNQLEQQYNPGLNSLRQTSTNSLQNYLNPSASQNQIQQGLLGQFNQQNQGPLAASQLFTNAANSAQQQLNLGGSLGQDTQNAVMRAGAAAGGSFGGPGSNGLNMGRDISARDLGLTSLQLQQQRQANAANIGGQQQNYNLSAQQAQLQNMLGLGGLSNNMTQQQFGNNLAMAQFTQGIQQPQVGLNPGSVAGIAVGNQNMLSSAEQQAAAIRAAQQAGSMQLAGTQMLANSMSRPGQQSGYGTASQNMSGGGYGLGSDIFNSGIGPNSPGWSDQPSYWSDSSSGWNPGTSVSNPGGVTG